jgi:hypothetical protein
MIRNLSILILITAFAGTASAQDIRVNVADKDDQTVQADIHKAAVKVCRNTYIGDPFDAFEEMDSCVAAAQDDAMAQVQTIRQAAASHSDVRALASLSTDKTQPGR